MNMVSDKHCFPVVNENLADTSRKLHNLLPDIVCFIILTQLAGTQRVNLARHAIITELLITDK